MKFSLACNVSVNNTVSNKLLDPDSLFLLSCKVLIIFMLKTCVQEPGKIASCILGFLYFYEGNVHQKNK